MHSGELDHLPWRDPVTGQGLSGRHRIAVGVRQPPALAANLNLAGVQASHGQQVGQQSRGRHVDGKIDLVLAEGTDDGDSLAMLLGGGHGVPYLCDDLEADGCAFGLAAFLLGAGEGLPDAAGRAVATSATLPCAA